MKEMKPEPRENGRTRQAAQWAVLALQAAAAMTTIAWKLYEWFGA